MSHRARPAQSGLTLAAGLKHTHDHRAKGLSPGQKGATWPHRMPPKHHLSPASPSCRPAFHRAHGKLLWCPPSEVPAITPVTSTADSRTLWNAAKPKPTCSRRPSFPGLHSCSAICPRWLSGAHGPLPLSSRRFKRDDSKENGLWSACAFCPPGEQPYPRTGADSKGPGFCG